MMAAARLAAAAEAQAKSGEAQANAGSGEGADAVAVDEEVQQQGDLLVDQQGSARDLLGGVKGLGPGAAAAAVGAVCFLRGSVTKVPTPKV